MASLIVWLCVVHVSKFNTVCVVQHRGGIRAAEQQQSSSRAAAEHTILIRNKNVFLFRMRWCTPQSRSSRVHTIRKRFQYAKTLYNNWYNMPTAWWS